MFGFIKNVFRTRGADSAAAPAVVPVQPVRPPVAVALPPPQPAELARTGAAIPRFRGRMERLLLNLKQITDRFPPELRGLIVSAPADGVIIAIPIEGVVEQLAVGRVEISIADLRRVSPIHIFSPDTSFDAQRVEIPLNEILPKLDPALLTRRSQRSVELPRDIGGVFENKRAEPEMAPVPMAPIAPQAMPLEPAQPVEPAPEIPVAPSIPEPPELPAPKLETPAFKDFEQLAAPAEVQALFARPPEPEPAPPPAPVEPSLDPSHPTPAIPEPGTASVIPVPLCQIRSDWPESIRNEIAHLSVDTQVEFPRAELETALKRGIVAFAWSQIRKWIVPAIPVTEFVHDFDVLNVPVSVVAPLFMAAARPIRAGVRVEVDESIPSLFSPQRRQPIVDAPLVSPPPVPAAPLSRSSETPGVERGPMEIVERACALNGIAGAIIASGEGLTIAAKLPPELNAETLGAFIPQVFSRLEQAVEPMAIGELKNVMFTAGERPWHILKSGTFFFAAMGRPNELLPSAQLKMLAAQLARLAKS